MNPNSPLPTRPLPCASVSPAAKWRWQKHRAPATASWGPDQGVEGVGGKLDPGAGHLGLSCVFLEFFRNVWRMRGGGATLLLVAQSLLKVICVCVCVCIYIYFFFPPLRRFWIFHFRIKKIFGTHSSGQMPQPFRMYVISMLPSKWLISGVQVQFPLFCWVSSFLLS